MSRKSRLRVQKEKKGRRGFAYFCLLCLIGTIAYKIDQKYEVVDSLTLFMGSAGDTLLPNPPSRGTIYDRNLKQIAVTMERVAVFVRTREVDSITDTAIALASALSLDSNKLINQMESGALRLWVAEDISQKQEETVKKLNLPGVHFQKDKKRYYPHGNQAAHLIGFVEDGIGLSGVEYHYDRLLATRKLEQQRQQKTLSVGQNLVLTLDLKIQAILEDLVEDIGNARYGAKVAAYLVESGTGELIAGAQYPGFDPNSFTRYTRKAIDNLFFEPLFLPDKFRLFLKDCATFYAQEEKELVPGKWAVAAQTESLGSQLRLWEWLQLSENSKVDFFTPKVGAASIDLNQRRMRNDTPPFGLIPEASTPINLLTAFSVLLNGAFDHSPYLVKEVLDIKTGEKVLLTIDETGLRGESGYPASPLPAVKRLFQSQAVVKETSAHYFRDEILVADKVSGGLLNYKLNDLTFVTIPAGERDLNLLVAVKRNPLFVRGRYDKRLSVESFIDTKVRRISILHQVAGTVEDVLEPEIVDGGNYQSVKEKERDIEVSLREIGAVKKKLNVMPNLVGMSLRKSLRILQGLPLQITIEGTGRVVRQEPPPGTSIEKVSSCHLVLGSKEKLKPENISSSPKK